MAMAKKETTTAMADSSFLATGLLVLVILGSGDRHGGIQKSEAARGILDRNIWKPTASLLTQRRSLSLDNGLGITPPMGCVSSLTHILHRFQFYLVIEAFLDLKTCFPRALCAFLGECLLILVAFESPEARHSDRNAFLYT